MPVPSSVNASQKIWYLPAAEGFATPSGRTASFGFDVRCGRAVEVRTPLTKVAVPNRAIGELNRKKTSVGAERRTWFFRGLVSSIRGPASARAASGGSTESTTRENAANHSILRTGRRDPRARSRRRGRRQNFATSASVTSSV